MVKYLLPNKLQIMVTLNIGGLNPRNMSFVRLFSPPAVEYPLQLVVFPSFMHRLIHLSCVGGSLQFQKLFISIVISHKLLQENRSYLELHL